MTIHVDIVSAEGEIYSGLAEMAYASSVQGELGIAPRHAPLLAQLRPGEVRVDEGSGVIKSFYISGGILEVQPHLVTVLADTAVRAADLDEAAAVEVKRRAEETLSGQQADFEYAKAQAELSEAVAQLRAIDRLRKVRQA
jgi:F-type H+-transporting ATPase subunit epsilon